MLTSGNYFTSKTSTKSASDLSQNFWSYKVIGWAGKGARDATKKSNEIQKNLTEHAELLKVWEKDAEEIVNEARGGKDVDGKVDNEMHAEAPKVWERNLSQQK